MAEYRDYRSPRDAHVDPHFDPSLDDGREYYASPRRNRYSRQSQTPRLRDVTWISAPQYSASPTPQTPQNHNQWIPSPRAPPPQPLDMPTPVIGRGEASPAPTEHEIAEHMMVDDVSYGDYVEVDPYRPHPKGSGRRLMKGLLERLKKISGFDAKRLSGVGSYETVQAPDIRIDVPSESLEYADPPPAQQQPSPYASPRLPQQQPSPYASPNRHPLDVRATPAVIPNS
ncbi:hypothetical protein HYDPIDRAFT_34488, partial [Hydnomerulius pinastri MD-312]